MIMRWPGVVPAGSVSDDLVMSIDICATILNAAGIEPPVPLHGKSLLGSDIRQREYVFAARDKMDETHDAMRAIRSKDHKLILNLMPERAYCQYNRYKEGAYPVLAEMNVLNLLGKLDPQQAAFFAATKPPVELFDLRNDPHEVRNLADDPQYASVKATLLKELGSWRRSVIQDQGVAEVFRAVNRFPDACPTPVMDDWVEANRGNYDFNVTGWPSWYPTRSLTEWQRARKAWEPYVFREPTANVPRPQIVHSKKRKKK